MIWLLKKHSEHTFWVPRYCNKRNKKKHSFLMITYLNNDNIHDSHCYFASANIDCANSWDVSQTRKSRFSSLRNSKQKKEKKRKENKKQ